MERKRSKHGSALLLLVAFVSLPASVHAELVAPALREARHSLARYDLEGGTTSVLRRLGRFMAHASTADRREARFLRAVAAVDLLVLVYTLEADTEIAEAKRRSIAAALGITAERLDAWLETELEALNAGPYAAESHRCRWALSAMHTGFIDDGRNFDPSDARRSALYLRRIRDASRANSPLFALSEMAGDPCAGGQTCAVGPLGRRGRRAYHALQNASRALAMMQRLARAGDPLAGQLRSWAASTARALEGVRLKPLPHLPRAPCVLRGPQPSRATVPTPELDLILTVDETTVAYGFVPGIEMRHGAPAVTSERAPALPELRTLDLPYDHRPAVLPYRRLATELAPYTTRENPLRVGVCAAPNVEATRVSRVMMSLVRDGLHDTQVVAADADGELVSIPTHMVAGRDVDAPLRLFVRLGGYTLHQRHHLMSIPRVHDAQGVHFDLSALHARVEQDHSDHAAVRYMGTVSWGTVLSAVVDIGAGRQELDLVLY